MPRFPFRNIVIITLDCVRPDFLGCYGCRAVETPTLDRLAAAGVVFEQAVTQAPNTWVSHAGLFTGLYPPLHGLRTPYDRIDPEVPAVASLLAENGYRCAGFPGNDLLGSRMGFGRGFDLYFEEYAQGCERGEERRGVSANNRNRWEDVLDQARGWLGRQRGPVFLWFHYLDTHHLPECDLPEYFRYGRDPCWQFYEGKISYADHRCLRPVLDLLLKSGFYEDALFLVLSDHGEELVPGRPPAHNGFLTEGVLRIPMILFGEHAPWKAMRVPTLVRTADIAPTLVQSLIDPPGSRSGTSERFFSGIPLPLPGIDREGRNEEGEELAYAENEPLGLSCLRSEQWKFVKGPEEDLLFHVTSDPQERKNVIDRNPRTAEYLREVLARIRSSGARGEGVRSEREQEKTRRLLRAFGYLE